MAPIPGSNAPLDSSSDIQLKFREILKDNEINDPVSEIIFQDSGLKGENMASVTQCVTVKFENPKMKPLNLFMKMQTPNPSHTEMIEEAKLFEKETLFFMKYIPAAREFCKAKGHEKLINIYPKCYYGDRQIVVFENLVLDHGYILLNKEEQQDFESACFAVTTLAKHHAIAYALMKEIGGAEAFFKRFPNLDFEAFHQTTARAMMEPAMENGIVTNIKILEKCDVDGKDDAISMLKAHQGKPFSMLLETLENDPGEENFKVLNHGDYWNNNMMFLKDKETNKVIGHKAIDLQVTRYSSPSIDLGYYFYTSVKGHVRRSRLEDLLTVYLDVLRNTSEDLGHPIELTYEQFFADYRKKFKFGYWFGTILSTGAGYAVLKDMDPKEIDMNQWATIFNKLIEKWIANNPEKSAENAKSIIENVKEYKILCGL